MTDAEFFNKLGKRFSALKGNLSAIRENGIGKWVVVGGTPSENAKFLELAKLGANRLGFVGTPDECVQYWLNCLSSPRGTRQAK